MTKGDLGYAHKGYIYQDITTAYFMGERLGERSGRLVVDQKVVRDDRFDDLTVWSAQGAVRRQFKRSENTGRKLQRSDLTSDSFRLRIDHLVRTFLWQGSDAAQEYRVCVTWLTPDDPTLLPYLKRETSLALSFPGHRTQMFRLDAEAIWPVDGEPVWSALRDAEDLTRQDFLAFAARFVLELECPQASLDFQNPGPMERLLLRLLTDRVGIGRYPNEHLDPSRTADQLAWRASVARARHEELTVPRIETAAALRTDYGREAQRFPVDRTVLVDRIAFLDDLQIEALRSERMILTGPPGSGKSWSMDRAAESLSAAGHLVARHYCYLEPGDERVERRVTERVLFANLMAELVDAVPELQEKTRTAYASGPEELAALLTHAVQQSPTGHVFLFVDGLDHITRVLSDSRSLAAEEADLVEELAALPLPAGVHLILGSQPGLHLKPLTSGATARTVPPWSREEIATLTRRIGVMEALERTGLGAGEDFLQELTLRSDGNPLFATYLCRELKERLEHGEAVEPVTFLQESPPLQGDLANYYDHLLGTTDHVGGLVANLLAALDFAVTVEELAKMLPGVSYAVKGAVAHLSPILVDVSAQGGLRIYHESFRRHILEHLRRDGVPLEAVLEHAIAWLEDQDFFWNAKAYRFLLPCLRRAGREKEVLRRVGPEFVSRSVAAGHPRRAIEANLFLTVDVAAMGRDWPALARCAHLLWSLRVCFDERFQPREFGEAFGEVFGYAALAERLLFEGRPAWPHQSGLELCALCDDAGVMPPWREYLAHPEPEREDDTRLYEFQGTLRLQGVDAVLPDMVATLHECEPHIPTGLMDALSILYRVGGSTALQRLLDRLQEGHPSRGAITTALAEAFEAQARPDHAARTATAVLHAGVSPNNALRLLRLGADPAALKSIPDPRSYAVTNPISAYEERKLTVRRWVTAVALTALASPERIYGLREEVAGEGWYRAWLCYVIDLSIAEARLRTDPEGAERDIIEAFQCLAVNPDPFAGDPRACDLSGLRDVIAESLDRGLALLRSEAAWREVTHLLTEVSRKTTTRLDRAQCGPLPSETLAWLLLPYISSPVVGEQVPRLLREQAESAEAYAELYEVHAAHEILLARALAAAGRTEESQVRWEAAARMVCAYGSHKEISLFEILESLPALCKVDSARARDITRNVQPLTETVLAHTNGKETQYAPNAWFKSLCRVDGVGAAAVLMESLVLEGGRISWILERSFREAVDALAGTGTPLLVVHLNATQLFDPDEEAIERRLSPVERLCAEDAEKGRHFLRLLAAEVEGDPQRLNTAAAERIREVAAQYGLDLPPCCPLWEEHSQARPEFDGSKREDASERISLFSEDATPLQIMAWIRVHGPSSDGHFCFDQLVAALAARLSALAAAGQEADAARVLRFFARETYFWSVADPLADLAGQLDIRGRGRLAAIAYALAYSRSRGDGGWLSLGGSSCHSWIARGLELSPEDTWEALASEVAHLLREGRFSGVARHLVELAAAFVSSDMAFEACRAAFEVVAYRLPSSRRDLYHPFAPYRPEELPAWTPDEVLFALLVARVSHPELRRKTAALAGCVELIAAAPDLCVAGLREAFRCNTPASSMLLLLQAILYVEADPYPITEALASELEDILHSGHFGLHWTAAALLFRLRGEIPYPIQRALPSDVSEPCGDGRDLVALDWGGRIGHLESLWPGFAARLTARFDGRWWAAQSHREHARDLHRAARSHVRKQLPETPLLFWEHELLECALHEEADGISAFLQATGYCRPETEFDLLQRLLPALDFHVTHWHSRDLRPPIPLPSSLENGCFPIVRPNGVGEFAGWIRCGYFERELLRDEKWKRDVTGTVIVVGALELGQGDIEECGNVPIKSGAPDTGLTWVADQNPSVPSAAASPSFTGPLVHVGIAEDLLGRHPVLTLDPRVVVALGLRPGRWPGRRELRDEEDRPAVVFRAWSVCAVGNELSEETPWLRGCDLLMRSDIYDQVVQLGSEAPLEIRRIHRTSRASQ